MNIDTTIYGYINDGSVVCVHCDDGTLAKDHRVYRVTFQDHPEELICDVCLTPLDEESYLTAFDEEDSEEWWEDDDDPDDTNQIRV
jgi:hypothetical protein